MTPADLVETGEAFHQALGREYYLTGAGLKQDAQFQAIYDQYAVLAGDEALAAARASASPALLEWIVDVRTGRRVAELEERQLAWEQQATVTVNGEDIPYLRVPLELANTADRQRRLALDEARTAAGAAGLNGMRRDRFAREHEVITSLGYPDYVSGIAALSGIDLDALGAAAAAFLASTADLYADALGRLTARRLGTPKGGLVRSDAVWTFRADTYDKHFSPDRLADIAVAQMREMALDARQQGRVRFDTEERPDKQPRAFCAPVRVPDEVYLVLRPRGGHADYRTFWHELGHAMHFAGVDPALPFAARWVGDNSVTEGFAMLWDHLTIHPAWLARYAGLSKRDAQTLAFELAVGELYMVRRYAAKLCYELELHRGRLGTDGAAYAERLTEATGFRYPDADYLLDVDPGFYSARYVRAWQLEAALAQALVERYDAEWYRNPRAGAFVLHLMARGQAEPADRLARDAVGAELTFDPIIERLTDMLA